MRGGVVPEEAYSLSDSYIQKIEKCRDIPAVFHLFYAAEYEYTRMVKELKEQKEGTLEKDKNPHINTNAKTISSLICTAGSAYRRSRTLSA